MDNDAPLFTISVAAHLSGMHPQTLRTYDRLGLVQPRRSRGRGRRYSRRDINRLRMIQSLSQDEGINLNGISRILEMDSAITKLQQQVDELLDQLARARSGAMSASSRQRVFTAESSGAVHMGRYPHSPRQLSVG